MMKKLLMWSALLMTGFAFYSCDDVVDNPVQDTSAVWNYAVNVKFADFNFGGLINPTTTEPYTYEAPKTLYVFNEQLQPLGEITTEKAPAAGSSAKYSGTLRGAIGDNLIIFTKTGAECAKQDGTIESAIENGIVQSATVAVKIYSNYNYNVSTEDAKMQNAAAIVKLASDDLYGGDKVAITTKDQSFEFTMNEDFDPTVSNIIYAAIPTPEVEDKDITISTKSIDGYMRGFTLTSAAYPLDNGKINDYTAEAITFQKTGVDLTIWAPQYREDNNYSEDDWVTFSFNIKNNESFEITQSSEEVKKVDIDISGNVNDKVKLIVNNVKLGESSDFSITKGATFDLTLIGENKFYRMNLLTPLTKKGTGTWTFERLKVGGKVTTTTDTELEIDKNTVDYFAEYTIDEDLTLKSLVAENGGKINIADGKKIKVSNNNTNPVSINSEGSINVGEGSELFVEDTGANSNSIIYISGGHFNIGKKAKVTASGYKGKTGMEIFTSCQWGSQNPNSSIKIGESASLELKGGITNSTAIGLSISNYYGGKVSIELDKNATLSAFGISRTAVSVYCNDGGRSNPETARPTTISFNIAEGAKVIANETEEPEAIGFSYMGTVATASNPDAILSITGKGTFETKSESGTAMTLNGKVNITGVDVTATGGTEKPAIKTFATTALTLTYSKDSATKLTAKAGTGSTICIADADDKELAKFAEASYTDTTADGVRTITPRAPTE